MTASGWRGGNGAFGAARLWSPRGVPGVGNTAGTALGDATVAGRGVGAVVDLGGTDGGAAPAVERCNASVSALTMPNDLPAGPYPDHGQEYAASAFGTVNGGAGSRLRAGNSTVEGGKVVVNAALAGQGTITVTAGIVTRGGFADAGTPGTQDNPASLYGSLGVGPQNVLPRGLAAPSRGGDATHAMTPHDGNAVLDTIRFGAGATSAPFQPGTRRNAGHPVGVHQASQGVRLAGEACPAGGDTGIPLHTAAGGRGSGGAVRPLCQIEDVSMYVAALCVPETGARGK